ncbi:hypothetical protein AB4043_26360, partial [Terriglobus sp. YAF25]|uniref:hypothetical protein n=1 Tax=Terriglobus sp. YAF25 TaxID=3233080 RepID=UPI003F9E6657
GADRLTHLRIRGNSRIQTLDSLQNFPMLHHLTLSGCAELSSLSSIAGLSLRHLTFSGLDKIGNLEALGELSSLEYLYVGSPSYLPRGLMNLPQGAPLRDLHLPGVPLPRGWLREIYRWPDLQYLTLGLHNSPQTVAEWEDIGSLGNLRSLATAGYSLAHLPESFSMPGVTQVLLTYRLASTLSLSKLRNHFPDLSNLYIGGRHASGGVVDLSPLADLPNLSHVGLRGIGKVVGVEKLPERVDVSVYGSAWLDQSHLYVDR